MYRNRFYVLTFINILFSLFIVTSKESILFDLYGTLEILRYPEVAQISFEEFHDKILTGPKRIDLLQWILTESPGFNNMSLNIIKANTLNDKLFKCYSQIGLCNDENVLFGKGPVEKESCFLSLLTTFIKNLHLVDEQLNDKTIIQSEKENLNTNNDNIDDKISKQKEDEIELKKEIKSEEFSKPSTTESCSDKYNIDILCTDIEEIKKEFNHRSHKNYEKLQNFNSSFQNVSSLSTQNTETVSEVYNNISSDLQDMHFSFLSVNKTLSNKTKIKNQPILENSMVITENLTSVIKDNLVLVEQACNAFMED